MKVAARYGRPAERLLMTVVAVEGFGIFPPRVIRVAYSHAPGPLAAPLAFTLKLGPRIHSPKLSIDHSSLLRHCRSSKLSPSGPRAGTVGDAIVVDGVPDPELIQKQVFTEVAFAAEACNLLRAASDAGQGCRYFRGGDGSERAIGRHETLSNRLRFFAGLKPTC